MTLFSIIALGILTLFLIVLLISFLCFRIGFYAPPRKPRDPDDLDLPQGKIYEPYWDAMRNWARETRALPQEDVSIISFDGLTLRGIYYEYAPGAPIELMFHGYRGNSERDLSGGVQRCFKLGRSALLVEQRCAGRSDGNVITFGVKEHQDCIAWVDFMIRHFGPDVKIILTGISMGATTVLLAGGTQLPKNVIGILADCGFSSAKEIIQTVIGKMGLPSKLAYPFVRLGARIFGNFDPNEADATKALQNCSVPVIFFHGQADDFVPCEMSVKNYETCSSRKKLVLIPGAGHGLSYPTDHKLYLTNAKEFFEP